MWASICATCCTDIMPPLEAGGRQCGGASRCCMGAFVEGGIPVRAPMACAGCECVGAPRSWALANIDTTHMKLMLLVQESGLAATIHKSQQTSFSSHIPKHCCSYRKAGMPLRDSKDNTKFTVHTYRTSAYRKAGMPLGDSKIEWRMKLCTSPLASIASNPAPTRRGSRSCRPTPRCPSAPPAHCGGGRCSPGAGTPSACSPPGNK